MNRPVLDKTPPPRWYTIGMLALGLAVLVLAMVAKMGYDTDQRQNEAAARENAKRDRQAVQVSQCFADFLAGQASSSKAIRVASETVTDAQRREVTASAARNRALQDVLAFLTAGGNTTDRRDLFASALARNAELITAQESLSTANAALAKARSENPVPTPVCQIN